MDFLATRRVGTTYGRSKRVLVHDLFENRNSEHGKHPTTLRNAPQSPIPLESTEQSNVHKTESIATGGRSPRHSSTSSSSPSSSSSHLQDLSEAQCSERSDTVHENSASLFDVSSSENEKDSVAKLKSRKRQKIAQPVRATEPDDVPQDTKLLLKSKNLLKHTIKPKGKAGSQSALHKATRQVIDLKARAANDSTVRPKQPLASDMPMRLEAKQRTHPHTVPPQDIPKGIPEDDVIMIDDYTGTDMSEQHTDRSTTSASETPKRKRILSKKGGRDTPSPSQLGLTALSFTPEKSSSSSRLGSPESASDEEKAPLRTRSRMIDRLDAPKQLKQKNSFKSNNASKPDNFPERGKIPQNNARVRGRARFNQENGSSKPHPDTTVERSQSSQNRTTYASRARTTYAKERSHLSDMVDGLDIPSVSASQQSNQGLTVYATKSNLASQLDFDDDDSDEQPGAKPLKSIHELRQAGTINRFDREVQALFEDIESSQLTKKSLRVQALTKLIRRLGDDAFLGYFVSTGHIKRLVACSEATIDRSGATLITMALYVVSKTDNSLEGLGQVLNGISNLAPLMLVVGKSLGELAVDGKENLSKSDMKSLVEFEKYALQHQLIPAYESPSICLDGLVLTCLDEVLRGLTRLGVLTNRMSSAAYTGILQLLERHAKRLNDLGAGAMNTLIVEKALSLLEACSIALDSTEFVVRPEQYQSLGESLAIIQQHTDDDHSNIERAVLRVVVGLSNNKPDMCHLLGKTPILKAVFLVVESNFVKIADHAEHERILDQGKLDSVILALGCLLNFSDCDGDSRRRLASSKIGSHTYTERLVMIFNSQVAKAQEVMTHEQGQVLVAFGYLSMLLCTMSLDLKVRLQITQLLKDRSFNELCAAAETFFSHLRTLETISEDDDSISAFTARFNVILETIRNTEI